MGASLTELRSAPTGTVAVTCSGFTYVKRSDGRWSGKPSAIGVSSTWLLDPEHSRQPVTILEGTPS